MHTVRHIMILTTAAWVASAPGNAHADFQLDSPNFEQGTLVFDSNNNLAIDHRDDINRSRSSLVDVAYGVTDWWQPTLQGEWDKSPGADYKYNVTNIQNTFTLTKPDEYWADVGFELNYNHPSTSHSADVAETKLLFEKTAYNFLNDLNLIVDKEVGGGSAGGITAEMAWKSEYQLTPMFNPGFEYYGNLGSMKNSGMFDADQRRIGPVFYGDVGHGMSYEAGWLFGLSHDAEDNVIKLNLSFEFPL